MRINFFKAVLVRTIWDSLPILKSNLLAMIGEILKMHQLKAFVPVLAVATRSGIILDAPSSAHIVLLSFGVLG